MNMKRITNPEVLLGKRIIGVEADDDYLMLALDNNRFFFASTDYEAVLRYEEDIDEDLKLKLDLLSEREMAFMARRDARVKAI
jgi:hypothetical protein